MEFKIEVDTEKCDGCGTCFHVCPKAGKLWTIEDKAVWYGTEEENLAYCHRCTNCLISCPKRAITVSIT